MARLAPGAHPIVRLLVRSPAGPAHPVAFGAAVFADLLSGDRGARWVLGALGDEVVSIDCDDPGVVFDIDHPADLQSDAGISVLDRPSSPGRR